MNGIIAWFAANRVAANLLMGLAVVTGLMALTRIPVLALPDLDVPEILVTVPYPGAAPEEVESGVCARVEEQLDGVSGVKEVVSVANEGVCTVRALLFHDADRSQALADVQNQVGAIDTFPDDVERPIIRFATLPRVVIEVLVTGPVGERDLKELAHRVRDDLLALAGIAYVTVANARPYEISIEVSEASLQRFGLTFDDVADAVRAGSADLPGGGVKTEQGEVLLRTRGQAYWREDLENLAVSARGDGTRVLLKDVARVVDGFTDAAQYLEFDGRPAALVQVSRVGAADLRQIAETVRGFVAASAGRYGDGVRLEVWNDQSAFVEERIRTLFDSGVQGLLLVMVMLALFLRPHTALWVAAGIPIAFAGALFLLFAFGYSIDALSLVGFILALGMVVDDAVVVGEGVYSAQRQGAGLLAGATLGTQRVFLPVAFGVLTSIAAFLPLLFTVGILGEILSVTAATVVCCLVASLVECQAVLPAHLGHRSERMPLGDFGMTLLVLAVVAAFAVAPTLRLGAALAALAAAAVFAAHLAGALGRLGVVFARWQSRFETAVETFMETRFRRWVELSLRERRMTLALAFAVLASAAGISASGHLPFDFLLPSPQDRVNARLTLPPGTSAEVTRRAIDALVLSARQVQRETEAETGEPHVLHVLEALGSHPSGGAVQWADAEAASHVAEVSVQLAPSEERRLDTDEIAARWRRANGPVADAVALEYVTDTGGSTALSQIDIRVHGDDQDELRDAVAAVRAKLGEYPGVFDVGDSLLPGKAELRLSVTPAGEALGITLTDLGRQVRQAFHGEEAQRIQRGRDDVRVMVRYPRDERRSLDALDSLRIRTRDGAEVPLRSVADVEHGRGLSSISRTDGKRTVSITARVDPAVTTAGEVLGALRGGFLQELPARYPGVGYFFESDRLRDETIGSLGPLMLLALFAIYALLAIPLRSYAQPFIIMAVLPFAFAGAVWGHLLMMGVADVFGFSMPSVFGVVAAGGVAINSTLVLMHGVNRFRAGGASLHDALVRSATTRFRPIAITAATTFVGVLPLMLSSSVQARALIPMAVSLAYGVLFCAVAALLVVPALWLAIHDLLAGVRRARDRALELATSASRLAQWIVRYPYVQESLRARTFTDLRLPDDLDLDAETARIARQGLVRLHYQREFGPADMREELTAIAASAASADALVAEVRRWTHQKAFQICAHMLDGAIAPVTAAQPMTDILDASLGALLRAAHADCAKEHGDAPTPRFALVAFGAVGRGEFAVGAPLELMLLYDETAPWPSTMLLDRQAWHAELTRRLMRFARDLSPQDLLYETPELWRPPPGGGEAPCTMASLLAHCHNASAADLRRLVHARAVADAGDFGAAFETRRRDILASPRSAADVAAQLAAQRAQSPPATGPFDIERRPGGLADIATAAEYLQLTAAHTLPELATIGLAPTFAAAANADLLPAAAAADLTRAADLWRNLGGFLRTVSPDAADARALSAEHRRTLAEICAADSFDALPRQIADTAERTARHIRDLLAR